MRKSYKCGMITLSEYDSNENGITINSNVDTESISMQKGLSNVFVRRVGT